MGYSQKERPNKARVREYALAKGQLERAAKCVVLLPAEKGHDIELGLKNGLLNRNTFVIAVEKNPIIAKNMGKLLSKNFNNFHVHAGPIETLKLDEVGPCKVDYAFLDFCGNLTPQIADWIDQYSNQFVSNNVIHFTFKAINRKKQFQNSIIKTCPESINNIDRHLENCRNNLVSELFTNGKKNQSQYNRMSNKTNIIISIKAICVALQKTIDREIIFDRIIKYRDTTAEMVLISVTITDKEKTETDIEKIFFDYDGKVGYNSQIRYKTPPKSKGKRKKYLPGREVYKVEIQHRTRFNIKTRKDLEKPAVKAALTKYANEIAKILKMDPVKKRRQIIAGINRSLTVAGR